MVGAITVWNDANGRGLFTADDPADGTFPVSRQECCQRLVTELSGKAIPPDQAVGATREIGPGGVPRYCPR
jgi:hypothetical protein